VAAAHIIHILQHGVAFLAVLAVAVAPAAELVAAVLEALEHLGKVMLAALDTSLVCTVQAAVEVAQAQLARTAVRVSLVEQAQHLLSLVLL